MKTGILCIFILACCITVHAQTISGNSAPVFIDIGEEEVPFLETKLPRIYAVVIGVSQYQQGTMNLRFADDDAQLYYNFLRSPQGGSVPESQITLLLNEKATRANIIKALNTQFKNAFNDDLIIVYIASHGLVSA